jgi:uncharacterized membrane protein
MRYRMAAATLSLTGFFVATYLYLYKAGFIQGLACGAGTCDLVQASPWGKLFGQPVALYGVAGYLGCLVAALIGIQSGSERRHWSDAILLAGGLIGVAFSAYLTYAEAFLIEAWCRWCVGSAVIITLVCVAALLNWRSLRPTA